MPIKSSA